jgi:hypothetical protein
MGLTCALKGVREKNGKKNQHKTCEESASKMDAACLIERPCVLALGYFMQTIKNKASLGQASSTHARAYIIRLSRRAKYNFEPIWLQTCTAGTKITRDAVNLRIDFGAKF